MINLFAIAAERDIGYGLTRIELMPSGRPKIRVKAWRRPDEDGQSRFEERLELFDGYWQPKGCDA